MQVPSKEKWAELAAARACGCKFGNPQCRTLQNANVDEHSSALVTILSGMKTRRRKAYFSNWHELDSSFVVCKLL